MIIVSAVKKDINVNNFYMIVATISLFEFSNVTWACMHGPGTFLGNISAKTRAAQTLALFYFMTMK